ncbi:ABC transporter ATP-binding protein [Mogibacterium sp. CM50]|jgi:ABC-type multidrug transport system, ATPase and permease components|uniref:ABC transporter ATP-binding protein n=1 Tax=Mogibacterium sp. CM50 TaxID=936375 RepID=UPI00027C5994|nr:ABC transporter ATP-binding protein [Mogibacterium sp. CM50]EJU21198.1 ABC transporter, ATP-binding protein [Mogibacterium sp. CM50]
MFKILMKFFRFSGAENKKRYYEAIFLGVIEAVGQAMKIPAIYILVTAVVRGDVTYRTIMLSLAVLVGGMIVQCIVSRRSKMQQTIAGYTTCAGKRIEIAEHLRYVPMGYFNETSLGNITSITTNTMELLADVATRVVMLTLGGTLESCLITVLLLIFDLRIGAVALAGLLIFFVINSFLQRHSVEVSKGKLDTDAAMVSEVLEFIQGIAEAKNFKLIGENNKKLDNCIDNSSKANIRMELKIMPFVTLQSWIIKMTGVLMCILSLRFYLAGTMDLATSIVMMIAAFLMYAALDSAGNFSALLRAVDISVDKAESVLAIENMDIDGEYIRTETQNIEMNHVDFAYDTRKVIDDLSLSIPEKSTVAFVGPSGSGKTTICHLIARFWDVKSGQVKLDNRDVRAYNMNSLMENFSFVFQSVYLFHDTIANNIRFGQPDASMDMVIDAAKKACCHDFISELPDGYDTVLGEAGASLSGGQKQRISIARAIMKDAPIIILDEATANVDPENERELMLAIKELTKEKTILMIAHRLKTVRNADRIYVIDKGRIAQQGTHEELMKAGGIYRDFVSARSEAIGWKL